MLTTLFRLFTNKQSKTTTNNQFTNHHSARNQSAQDSQNLIVNTAVVYEKPVRRYLSVASSNLQENNERLPLGGQNTTVLQPVAYGDAFFDACTDADRFYEKMGFYNPIEYHSREFEELEFYGDAIEYHPLEALEFYEDVMEYNDHEKLKNDIIHDMLNHLAINTEFRIFGERERLIKDILCKYGITNEIHVFRIAQQLSIAMQINKLSLNKLKTILGQINYNDCKNQAKLIEVYNKLYTISKYKINTRLPERDNSNSDYEPHLYSNACTTNTYLNDYPDITQAHTLHIKQYVENRVSKEVISKLQNENIAVEFFLGSYSDMVEFYKSQEFIVTSSLESPTSTKIYLLCKEDAPDQQIIVFTCINSKTRLKHQLLQLHYAEININKILLRGNLEHLNKQSLAALKSALDKLPRDSNKVCFLGTRKAIIQAIENSHNITSPSKSVFAGGFKFDHITADDMTIIGFRMPNGSLAYQVTKTLLESGISKIVMVGAGGSLEENVEEGSYRFINEATYEGVNYKLDSSRTIVPSKFAGLIKSTAGYNANVTVNSPLEESQQWLEDKKADRCAVVDVETAHIFKAFNEYVAEHPDSTAQIVPGLFISDVVGVKPLEEKITAGNAYQYINPFIDSVIDRPGTQPNALKPAKIQGIDEVANHPEQGIPLKDIIALAKYANENDRIIIIRPVEAIAKNLLATNEYPGKPFLMKQKSSNWGPHAGYITSDPMYSKSEADPEKIKKLRAQSHMGDFAEVNLTLKKDRFYELVRLGQITVTHEDNNEIKLTSQGPSGKTYEYIARIEGGFYEILDAKQAPIKVLADKITYKEIVPDLDLLSVGFPMKDVNQDHNMDIKDVHHSVYIQRINCYKQGLKDAHLIDLYENKKSFYANERSNFGNSSNAVQMEVTKINKALNCQSGLEKVIHLADESNPVADPNSNYPATVFLPQDIKGLNGETLAEVCMISDRKEFAYIIQSLVDAGYYIFLNPRWEKEIASIRRTSFSNGQHILEKHLQTMNNNATQYGHLVRRSRFLNAQHTIKKHFLQKPILSNSRHQIVQQDYLSPIEQTKNIQQDYLIRTQPDDAIYFSKLSVYPFLL